MSAIVLLWYGSKPKREGPSRLYDSKIQTLSELNEYLDLADASVQYVVWVSWKRAIKETCNLEMGTELTLFLSTVVLI